MIDQGWSIIDQFGEGSYRQGNQRSKAKSRASRN